MATGDRLKGRLRVRWPDASYRGFILEPSAWQLTVPFNDVSSLTVTLHENSTNFKLLNRPLDVAFELFNESSNAYQEYTNCRFLNIKQTGNMMSGGQNRDGEWQFELPGYAWMLKKALNVKWGEFKDGRRTFTDKSVGNIIQTFIQDSRERKNLLYLNENFNSAVDSAGKAWKFDSLTESFDAGQDLLSILQDFANRGLCDWRMNRRTLEVYNPDTFLARDFSSHKTAPGRPNDQRVVIRPYLDVIQEPTDVTREDLARRCVVQGDNNKFVSDVDETVPGPWGAWETFVSAGGISKESTLKNIAIRRLQQVGGTPKPQGQRVQLTKEMHIGDGSSLPIGNYRPGDYISGPDFRAIQFNDPDPWVSKLAKLRVQQITMSFEEPYGIRTSLTLQNRFAIRALKAERWLNRIVNDGAIG